MQLEILTDADAVARRAAAIIAAEARSATEARGRFTFAVSGGHTPWLMLRALADEDVPWQGMHVFQVDERIAPAGHVDRNLTHIRESLVEHHDPSRPDSCHAGGGEPICNLPPPNTPPLFRVLPACRSVLDLVAQARRRRARLLLVPGDPVLDVADVDVALTGVIRTASHDVDLSVYQPRRILWIVTAAKAAHVRASLQRRSVDSSRARRQDYVALIDTSVGRPS